MGPSTRFETSVGAAALIGLGLSALASLIAHQLAYVAVLAVGALGADDVTTHGHLATQWALVTPVAVLSASAFVLAQVRRLGVRNEIPVALMALVTIVLFVAQETIEGRMAGNGVASVVTSPAVVVGVAITPLVVWVLARVLGGVSELVRRFVETVSVDLVRPASFPAARSVALVPLRVVAAASPRGPPARR